MFSKFFIDRPIFASVIAIVIMLIGAIALTMLPVEKTPNITPPTVMVTAHYPGANAETVAETVATPLEEAINGVDNMIYMSSSSSDNGTMMLTVTFKVGTDIDMATVLVQNRVSQAEPLLPEEVIREGVTTRKRSTNIAMMVSFYAIDGRYDDIYMSNYVTLNVKDVLARVPGVGEVNPMGDKSYGMRVWLDPERLRAHELTTDDVVAAIREQNIQVAAGQIGSMPSPPDQQFQYTIKTLGRLSTPQEFREIIIRSDSEGRLLRLGDVARIELGSEMYYWNARLRGQPSIAVAIYTLPGANALEVVDGVREALANLEPYFPEGLAYTEPYSPTLFIRESIREVFNTLLMVVALVILTVFVFLEDWRATLIPSVAIPVSLIGTFAVMMALGLSINTMTLFGLVLAIGIVVDDAIVVVENTVRIIDDEGLPRKEAAAKAMRQVTGPVIATTLVLTSVFVPTVLSGGITGMVYQQFALTIVVATWFSSLTALTLSPAMCGLLLRSQEAKHGRFFSWFDRFIKRSTTIYGDIVKVIIRKTAIGLLLFAILTVVALIGFDRLPTGFLPDEDEGTILIGVRLPEASSLLRTDEVMKQIQGILEDTEGVANYVTISGFSLLDMGVATNGGACFVNLAPWSERTDPELHIEQIIHRLQSRLSTIPEALCLALQPPPIMGLGIAGGFEVHVQDRSGAGLQALADVGNTFLYETMNDPVITRLNSSFRASVPQLYLDVDRVKAQTMDVPLGTVFNTLQTYLGSTYVNDFNLYGRTFRVIAQAEPHFRATVEDIGRLEVRNRSGQMVPLRTLVTVRDIVGPQSITRYNMYPATTITGTPRMGYTTGQSIERVAELLDQMLPETMGYEWSGMSYQEIEAGGKTVFLFVLAAVFAYLFLAAQYESWSIPIAIVLSVPLGLLGAVGFVWLRMMDNNIYTQMGVVLLIGVVCKTAILLVEFAKQLHEEGRSIYDAAVEAARLRFRPILMTALTTALGMVPLVIASGAGAEARKSLGTTVFGGMMVATVLGVFMIPIFYVVVQRTKETVVKFERKIEKAVLRHPHHQDSE